MELRTLKSQRPDVSGQERLASELLKKIRKLRWIGLYDEARRLEGDLCRLESAHVILAEPADTD